MKIAFNPSTVAALTTPPNNKDITFDLRGRNIFARGVKFQGTDTWRDIKINNVSIGNNTLDLRNGSNTTLSNKDGVVTINSIQIPVVDNLTSDSTTSSLSANQGRVLAGLINSKLDSEHNHDDRYLRLTGGTMQLGKGLKFHSDNNYFGTDLDARIISLLDGNDVICDGGLIIDERATYNGTEYVTELLRIRDSEFKWKGSNILHSGNSYINGSTITINGSSLTVSKSDHIHDYLVVNRASESTLNSAYHNFQVLFAGGSNGLSGKPSGVDAFGLIRLGAADGYSGQMLLANGGSLYIRSGADSSLNNKLAWRQIIDSTTIGSQIVKGAYMTPLTLYTATLISSGYLASDYTNRYHTEEYMKAAAKYLQKNYPGYSVFGTMTPNAYGFFTAHIYSDGFNSNGYPQQITIHYYPHGGDIINCGTSYGTWYYNSVPKSGHTHSWQSITDKVIEGKEFNIVSAGYNNNLWFNYLPIDNRNSSATISQYNMGNGKKGLASVYANRFKVDGKSCMWKDARNYAPFYATFDSGWVPILNIKTVSGDWSIGSYDGIGNHLIFAYESDSDFNSGVNGTANYWLSPDGEFKINTLMLAGPTNANMGVGSTNPQIIFSENSIQQVALTYTDQNTYRVSKGLKVHSYDGSDDSNVWFEVQGYNYSSGYVKNGSSDSYVLLGGGGHKPLSEFQLGIGSYLPYNGCWSNGSGQDVNDANGMIFAYASHKNTPFSSSWGIITTFDYTYNSAYKFQLAANGYYNAMYYRSRSTDRGGWTSWAQVIDTENISSQTVANAYHLRINSANTWSTWYWQGQSGQPTWLWGCNDGGNMYIWNPSNFSVKYATSAGYVSNSLNIFGVSYNGSTAKTVTPSTFVSQLPESTSTVTDGTMFITSVVSNSGFADTSAVNVPYKRKASCLWSYIDSKVSSKYLPLAGGTMNGNARIGHGSGNLYIGNSGNDGWIYTQNIASQNGTSSWNIRQSGAARFGKIHIASKNDETPNSNVIESDSGYSICLNYFSSQNISLCNGGGTVQIGSYTTGDTGSNKLYVNGSEFIDGASNVRNHVFADGFRHRRHNSDDSVLLAGGGYSQGVPVKYWSIESITIHDDTQVSRNRSGNYTFITKVEPYMNGACTLTLQFPSGYDRYNTMIWARGQLNESESSDLSNIYATIVHLLDSKYRLVLADNSTLSSGSCQLYFMCF